MFPITEQSSRIIFSNSKTEAQKPVKKWRWWRGPQATFGSKTGFSMWPKVAKNFIARCLMVFEPFGGGWAEVETKFLRSRTLANGRETQHVLHSVGDWGPISQKTIELC